MVGEGRVPACPPAECLWASGEMRSHMRTEVRTFFRGKQPRNLTAWSGMRLPERAGLVPRSKYGEEIRRQREREGKTM